MRTITAKLSTEREVLVGIPDELETSVVAGNLFIVEPGSGVSSPKVLLSPTAALKQGLLVPLPEMKPGEAA